MNESPEYPERKKRFETYLMPFMLMGEPAVEIIEVPVTNGRFDVKICCTDDSLPTTFVPQEGHWIIKGEYYDLIGSNGAINSDKVVSLALMKDGVRLNPYGDDKISYGISSARFKAKKEFHHIVISRN